MDLLQAVNHRHSYRDEFEPTPIPRDDLTQIVEAGIRAPSGYNAQSTSFVILDDPDTVRRVLAEVGDGIHLRTAPAAVVVVMDRNASADRDYSFGVQDYSAATENMLLTATALGYAGLWIEGGLRRDEIAVSVGRALDVPEPLEVTVVIPMGVPKEWKQQKEKKQFEERAWFNGYGREGG